MCIYYNYFTTIFFHEFVNLYPMVLACSLLLATFFKHATSKLINLRHTIPPRKVQHEAVLRSNVSLSPLKKQILHWKKTTLFLNLTLLLYIITSQCPPLQTTHFFKNLDSSMSCQERTMPLVNRTTSLPLPWLHLMKNDPFSDVPSISGRDQSHTHPSLGMWWVIQTNES
jgi:hypothetical protein